jgi:hypothetical protein
VVEYVKKLSSTALIDVDVSGFRERQRKRLVVATIAETRTATLKLHVLFRTGVFVLETNEHLDKVQNLIVGFAVHEVNGHNVSVGASHGVLFLLVTR